MTVSTTEPSTATAPRGRRSRRPSMNLNLSSISPLTATDGNVDGGDGRDVRSSYLQASSAPSTPGILSRSSSAHRHYRSFAALPLTSLTPYNSATPLPKSKSSSHLARDGRSKSSHRRRKSIGPRDKGRDSSEWLSRTGAAVSEETRLSKGQSWLMSRASSTSLVDDSDDEKARHADVREPDFIDDIFRGDGFGDEDDVVAVNDDDESLHWSAASGTVFGAWVDRIMGWGLFDVDEEDEDEQLGAIPARNRRLARGQIKREPSEASFEPKDRKDEGWQDAAWIFAIATKVLL